MAISESKMSKFKSDFLLLALTTPLLTTSSGA